MYGNRQTRSHKFFFALLLSFFLGQPQRISFAIEATDTNRATDLAKKQKQHAEDERKESESEQGKNKAQEFKAALDTKASEVLGAAIKQVQEIQKLSATNPDSISSGEKETAPSSQDDAVASQSQEASDPKTSEPKNQIETTFNESAKAKKAPSDIITDTSAADFQTKPQEAKGLKFSEDYEAQAVRDANGNHPKGESFQDPNMQGKITYNEMHYDSSFIDPATGNRTDTFQSENGNARLTRDWNGKTSLSIKQENGDFIQADGFTANSKEVAAGFYPETKGTPSQYAQELADVKSHVASGNWTQMDSMKGTNYNGKPYKETYLGKDGSVTHAFGDDKVQQLVSQSELNQKNNANHLWANENGQWKSVSGDAYKNYVPSEGPSESAGTERAQKDLTDQIAEKQSGKLQDAVKQSLLNRSDSRQAMLDQLKKSYEDALKRSGKQYEPAKNPEAMAKSQADAVFKDPAKVQKQIDAFAESALKKLQSGQPLKEESLKALGDNFSEKLGTLKSRDAKELSNFIQSDPSAKAGVTKELKAQYEKSLTEFYRNPAKATSEGYFANPQNKGPVDRLLNAQANSLARDIVSGDATGYDTLLNEAKSRLSVDAQRAVEKFGSLNENQQQLVKEALNGLSQSDIQALKNSGDQSFNRYADALLNVRKESTQALLDQRIQDIKAGMNPLDQSKELISKMGSWFSDSKGPSESELAQAARSQAVRQELNTRFGNTEGEAINLTVGSQDVEKMFSKVDDYLSSPSGKARLNAANHQLADLLRSGKIKSPQGQAEARKVIQDFAQKTAKDLGLDPALLRQKLNPVTDLASNALNQLGLGDANLNIFVPRGELQAGIKNVFAKHFVANPEIQSAVADMAGQMASQLAPNPLGFGVIQRNAAAGSRSGVYHALGDYAGVSYGDATSTPGLIAGAKAHDMVYGKIRDGLAKVPDLAVNQGLSRINAAVDSYQAERVLGNSVQIYASRNGLTTAGKNVAPPTETQLTIDVPGSPVFTSQGWQVPQVRVADLTSYYNSTVSLAKNTFIPKALR